MIMPFFQRVNDLVDIPEDPKEFEKEVMSAIEKLYMDGSRTFKMHGIYDMTRWQRSSSTSRKIMLVLKKVGVKKLNETHYSMGNIPEIMKAKKQ